MKASLSRNRHVGLVILCLWGSLGCTAMIAESYRELRLSDDGYGDIPFLPRPPGTIRTTHLFEASVTSGDRCRAFYDIAFLLDNNGIKRLAGISLNRLESAMRLVQSSSWSFGSNPDATVLRKYLDFDWRRMQWVGMSTTLVHAGRFVPSNDPPRSLVRDAEAQDCYFDVQAQYFIKFNAPTFIHIIVLDTTPRCGSRLLYDEKFRHKNIERAALKTWIDGFGIERDQQRFLDDVLHQTEPVASIGVQFEGDAKAVRNTGAYQDAVKRCHENDIASRAAQ